MSEAEISPREFAEALDVHYETILSWCFRAICESGDPLHGYVRQTITGRYKIRISAVKLIQDTYGPAPKS